MGLASRHKPSLGFCSLHRPGRQRFWARKGLAMGRSCGCTEEAEWKGAGSGPEDRSKDGGTSVLQPPELDPASDET